MPSSTLKTLQEAYTALHNNPDKNCYYYRDKFSDTLLPTDAPLEFIKSYLERAEKGEIFPSNDYLDLLQNNDQRCSHTVSAFLLGILIYDKVSEFQCKMDKTTGTWELQLGQKDQEPPRLRFLYSWFLCCLCHDLGYLYEKPVSANTPPKQQDVKRTIKKGLVQYNTSELLLELPMLLGKNMLLYALARLKGEIGSSGKETVDHGIAGGILLYDTLKKYHEAKTQTPEHRMKEIFASYGRAVAWTVFCHNMWFVRPNERDNVKKYKACGLSELIQEESPFTWSQHPLFTLLCLVDTIEPVKLFKEDVDILNKISIEFDSDRMSLFYDCPCKFFSCVPPVLKDKLWFLANEHLQVGAGGNCLTIQFQ